MILTQEQKDYLNTVVNGTWSLNSETSLVDVTGNVYHYKLNPHLVDFLSLSVS